MVEYNRPPLGSTSSHYHDSHERLHPTLWVALASGASKSVAVRRRVAATARPLGWQDQLGRQRRLLELRATSIQWPSLSTEAARSVKQERKSTLVARLLHPPLGPVGQESTTPTQYT